MTRDERQQQREPRPAEAALARWLGAEATPVARHGETSDDRAMDDRAMAETAMEDAADHALAALFAAALPAERVPSALSARLFAVAEAAAAERSDARRSLFGLRRRVVERLAALLVLATGLSAAGVQLLFSETAGPALSRLTPGQVLSSAAEGIYSLFRALGDALGAAANTFETLTQLSGAVATVAGTVPVAAALGLALLLATVAFRLLKDLLARERGWTHVERE